MIPIRTRDEYKRARKAGFEPLMDFTFDVEIELRKELQTELFGPGHSAESNERFYRWCWEHRRHICEETLRPLPNYSAVHISHILTRGAHPEMAHDPRNVNILSLEAHNRWENGDRESMRIFSNNQRIIKRLKADYGV